MVSHEDPTAPIERVNFNAYLEGELGKAGRADQQVGIIRVDLDRGDDAYDPAAHDAVMDALAKSLRELLQTDESVVRLGGNDFAAIIRFGNPARLQNFVQRLKIYLQSYLIVNGTYAFRDASLGVAVHPADASSAAELLGNAELALRTAKANPARRVCFFAALPDMAVHAKRITGQELSEAVDREEFVIAYQVQKSLVHGEAVGYEALLRWQHPKRGLVPPTEFIPVAEETGAIARIGEWVILKACRDAVQWQALRRVAVNVSPLQLTRDDLPDFIARALAETGLAANRLELEVTESAMIVDKAKTLKILQRIRELGVTLALDDFGVGYSSLDVLKSFPFDKIKLDRTFMTGFPHEAKSQAIIKAVLSLGRSLSMAVLAEGVERQEQLDLLRAEGYDQAQGLLLGYPEFGEPGA